MSAGHSQETNEIGEAIMKQTGMIPQVTSKLVALAAAWGLASAARGGVYTSFSGTPSQAIPDNNPAGVAYGFNFGNPGLTAIESVIVTFTISGGRNGDLYACLSRGTDTLVLLNRVGVANGTSGSTLYS